MRHFFAQARRWGLGFPLLLEGVTMSIKRPLTTAISCFHAPARGSFSYDRTREAVSCSVEKESCGEVVCLLLSNDDGQGLFRIDHMTAQMETAGQLNRVPRRAGASSSEKMTCQFRDLAPTRISQKTSGSWR
jgi:hypothetical protein